MTSAETRFDNDRIRAAQAAMGNNLAARNAMRPKHKVNRVLTKTSGVAPQLVQPPPVMPMPNSRRMPVSTPQALPQSFDQVTDSLIRQVRLEKLLSSPEAQDANTLVSLRDFWNNRDSGPDRGRQVADILDSYAD